MSKIIFYGDIHLKLKPPFNEYSKSIVNWIIDSEYNNPKNYLVILGDITDKSMNQGEINYLLVKLAANLKYKRIYYIHGNHEYSYDSERQQNSSSINLFKNYFSWNIIEEKETLFKIENLTFLGLPYIKGNMVNQRMKTYYENLQVEPVDFLVGHLSDKTCPEFGHFTDLSKIKVNKKTILGHIHNAIGNSIGSMNPTRYSEKNKESTYLIYDIKEDSFIKEEVPLWIDYYTYDYDTKEFPEVKAKYPIFDIKNAPHSDKNLLKKELNILYIREVYLKVSINSSIDLEENNTNISSKVLWKDYQKSSEIDSEVLKIIEHYGV